MKRFTAVGCWPRLVALSLGLLPVAAGADQRPAAPAAVSPLSELTEADLAEGRAQFQVHCARCHGMLGEGGEGPSLKRPRLRHAGDDEALLQVISEGIPDTGMPATMGPNDAERWRIAGYVRSLGRLPEETPPGDPERGAEVYRRSGGCPACHIVQGEGRGVGPELSDVGLRRNAAYLRRALMDPDAEQPVQFNRMDGRRNAFLTVRLTAADGEYEGLRISEDEFSIQLRDLAGGIHSFDKQQLSSFEKAFGHSLMPGYDAVLAPRDVDDVVSYLMSLRGPP